MRAAAIDVGTNTVLLVVAESGTAGPRALLERATITRLGAGVERTRAIDPSAARRTLDALAEYATLIRQHSVSAIDAVGTSALRDASGADSFLAEATRLLAAPLRVIDGEEEALLTFRGATSGLELSGDVVVFDIGGGSTEIVRGRANAGAVVSSESVDVGSVRLFERWVRSDPPSAEAIAGIARDIARAFSGVAPSGAALVVGVAGTVTTLAAIDRGVEHEPGRLHGVRLARARVDELARKLTRMPLAERLRLPGVEAGRADVIPVGALVARALLGRLRTHEIRVSDRGVRWGLIERRLTAALP
jgi:exopolyphosphatase / guanosine-5'-triphosphate,3'-diphosphate pyrophosphatase